MRTQSTIDHLRVATPCPVSWEQMAGDDRVRFCDHCRLNVYNISELTRVEAESLVASTEGRLCARLYQRADGTVLTKDCPVGLRALRKRVSRRVAAVFALLVGVSSSAFGQQKSDRLFSSPTQSTITQLDTTSAIVNTIFGSVHASFGVMVPEAVIVINGAALAAPLTIKANQDGRFEAGILAPGLYAVTISAPGFPALTLENIVIGPHQTTNIEAVLQPGRISMGLMLIPPDPSITEPRRPGTTVINQDMIKRLPLQRNNEIPFFKY